MSRALRVGLLALAGLLGGPAGGQAAPPPAAGRVVVLPALPMAGLQRERVVRVYLPAGAGSGRRFAVIYMPDGQNLFDAATSYAGEWAVDETLDEFARRDGWQAIVVGIDHGGDRRVTELNPWSNPRFGAGEGEAFLRFVVEVVKPLIDARFPTRPGREHTAIVGSSLGGLIAQAALQRHPQVFSKAGVLSPAFWIAPEIFALARDGTLAADSRIYLSVGSREGLEAWADAARMAALLQARLPGGVTLNRVPGAGHDEAAWRAEFPRVLRWLFRR